jgi:hypothetical protein
MFGYVLIPSLISGFISSMFMRATVATLATGTHVARVLASNVTGLFTKVFGSGGFIGTLTRVFSTAFMKAVVTAGTMAQAAAAGISTRISMMFGGSGAGAAGLAGLLGRIPKGGKIGLALAGTAAASYGLYKLFSSSDAQAAEPSAGAYGMSNSPYMQQSPGSPLIEPDIYAYQGNQISPRTEEYDQIAALQQQREYRQAQEQYLLNTQTDSAGGEGTIANTGGYRSWVVPGMTTFSAAKGLYNTGKGSLSSLTGVNQQAISSAITNNMTPQVSNLAQSSSMTSSTKGLVKKQFEKQTNLAAKARDDIARLEGKTGARAQKELKAAKKTLENAERQLAGHAEAKAGAKVGEKALGSLAKKGTTEAVEKAATKLGTGMLEKQVAKKAVTMAAGKVASKFIPILGQIDLVTWIADEGLEAAGGRELFAGKEGENSWLRSRVGGFAYDKLRTATNGFQSIMNNAFGGLWDTVVGGGSAAFGVEGGGEQFKTGISSIGKALARPTLGLVTTAMGRADSTNFGWVKDVNDWMLSDVEKELVDTARKQNTEDFNSLKGFFGASTEAQQTANNEAQKAVSDISARRQQMIAASYANQGTGANISSAIQEGIDQQKQVFDSNIEDTAAMQQMLTEKSDTISQAISKQSENLNFSNLNSASSNFSNITRNLNEFAAIDQGMPDRIERSMDAIIRSIEIIGDKSYSLNEAYSEMSVWKGAEYANLAANIIADINAINTELEKITTFDVETKMQNIGENMGVKQIVLDFEKKPINLTINLAMSMDTEEVTTKISKAAWSMNSNNRGVSFPAGQK